MHSELFNSINQSAVKKEKEKIRKEKIKKQRRIERQETIQACKVMGLCISVAVFAYFIMALISWVFNFSWS